MKVALCISGQPRNVQYTYPYIYENLIEPNNADVFIHSWISEDIVGKPFINSGNFIASNIIPQNIDQIILDLYNPKKYIFEPQKYFDGSRYEERKYPGIKPENSISQRYSVFESINLALPYQYDCIIRIRFDWGIQIPVEVVDFELSALNCPDDSPHDNSINDQFGFGNSKVMSHYGDLYNNMDNLYNRNIPFCDEILLYHHMMERNIPMNLIHIPYQIIRQS
jgi:hypothetical protein